MNQLTAMAWKEWRESRVYLWIGLGIFIGLPSIGEFEAVFNTTRRFVFDGSSCVVAFGGVVAVIVAIASTCRDLHGRIEDFWRSRPVGITRWWIVKYAVGLAIVLTVCALPIAIELCFKRTNGSVRLLLWYPAFWAAIYGIGFLAGCVIRRTAHAATLALAGLLLLYLMPLILPPLHWMNATDIPDTRWPESKDAVIFGQHELLFAVGMTGLAIAGLLLALAAVRHDWHVMSGRKTLYALLATAMLLLFASAGYQLGTNLPVLQQVEVPRGETVQSFRCEGNKGFVLTSAYQDPNKPYDYTYRATAHHLRTLELTAAGIRLGNPTDVDEVRWQNLTQYWFCRLSPEVGCRLVEHLPDGTPDLGIEQGSTPHILSLVWFNSLDGNPLGTRRLWDVPKPGTEPLFYAYAWKDRLYIAGTRLIIMDIGDPAKPQITSNTPFHGTEQQKYWDTANPYVRVPLLDIPGLPAEERLRLALQWHGAFDGTTLCVRHYDQYGEGSHAAYHLTKLTPTFATFDEFAQSQPSLIEPTFGIGSGYGESLQNGLLYLDGNGGNSVFNSAVSVFDTRDGHQIKRIGHFAAPGVATVCPLPDGRAIIGGLHALYLVGPPPVR